MGTSSPGGGSPSADGRPAGVAGVLVVVAVTAAAAAALAIGVLPGLDRPAGPAIPWWLVAVGFAATQVHLVHFEHRRETHAVSLTAIPLVVGLFTLSPLGLVAAGVAGSAVALGGWRRQPPLKLAVNVGSVSLGLAAAVAVFHAVAPAGDASPATWPAAVAAALISDQVQAAVVTAAISAHQRRVTWSAGPALHGPLAAVVDTSVGLVAVVLLRAEPAALALLVPLLPLLLASYRAHTRLREEHRNLGQLHAFTTGMGTAVLGDRVLSTLLEQARELMHAEEAWLCLTGEDGRVARATVDPDGSPRSTPMPSGGIDDLLHLAAQRARGATLVRAGGGDAAAAVLAEVGLRDAIVAPLAGQFGVVGTLVVADRSGEARGFGPGDVRLFATLANHACVALQNSHLVDRLRSQAAASEHQSLHDPLTGLANRTLFGRRLAAALPGGTPVVLLLDLDRFKEVNDTLGHHCGDSILEQVGRRLSRLVGPGHVVARLGGDEFAVLLESAGREEAEAVARSLLAAVDQPFDVADVSIGLGASIGMALAPSHGTEVAVLLQRADVAMYNAKRDQSGLEVYDPERDDHSTDRLALVAELRSAVERRELVVHYQPQVDLVSGRVAGAEALVRWIHPRRGFIAPDEFISVAEQSGLIGPLTMLVLEDALRQCAAWRARGWDLRVSVNLSARSLLDASLADDVRSLLGMTGVPAEALCLEVTETSMMADPRRTAEALQALADAGVTIAVDDFGTGYSSLAYLKRLPVGEIKIDKGFVMALGTESSDEAIVRSVVDLARNLGLPVVAEGVETEATTAFLRGIGCAFAQGYHYSRPVPAPELTAWLTGPAAAPAPLLAPRAHALPAPEPVRHRGDTMPCAYGEAIGGPTLALRRP